MPTPHILICSDIHFGSNRQRLAGDFLRALDEVPKNRSCVVIPGDLVQSGSSDDYTAATGFIEAILERGAHSSDIERLVARKIGNAETPAHIELG